MICRIHLLRLVVCAVFSVSVFNAFTKASSHLLFQHPLKSTSSQYDQDVTCPQSPLADDILVILRTGATESLEKVPVHFRTTLRCAPHYTIYSDLDEEIEGHQVRDVLAGVSPKIKSENDDFKLYRHLQEHGRDGLKQQKVITALSGSSKGDYLQTENAGWQLDKWKFLPMIDQALQERPSAKWFVFIEADTYLGWENLLAYLGNFDDTKPYYMGKHLYINNVEFGYGGAGFVLSNSAMRKVAEQRSTRIDEYEEFTRTHWVGDCALGKVMEDAKIPFHRAYPHFQGDSPATLNPAVEKLGRHLWCHPAITFHHVSAPEIEQLWRFEQAWHKQHDTLLRHRDIFAAFIRPQISGSQAGWDNMADEHEYNAHDHSASDNAFERNAWKSFDHCRALCDHQHDCLQFSFDTGSCGISKTFRLGYAKPTERIRSGWMLDRVDDLFRGLEDRCGVTDWFLPVESVEAETRMRRKRMAP